MKSNESARRADNDNVPVFDRGREPLPALFDDIEPSVSDDEPTGVGRLSSPASQAAARMRREVEKAAMQDARLTLARRNGDSDPACPANDNQDLPILAVLRRDGNEPFVRLVLRYRKLVALVGAQPLQGQHFGDGNAEHVTQKLKGATAPEVAIDAAEAADWPDHIIPGGELTYKGSRRVKPHGETPPTRVVVANDETRMQTAPLAVKFSEDVLIAQIDAKPILAELRASLGPLIEPFEDAVLGGRTFTAIGAARGFGVKPDVAGKALVLEAIASLDATWHDIAVRERKRARLADQAALRARRELLARQEAFLGRAA